MRPQAVLLALSWTSATGAFQLFPADSVSAYPGSCGSVLSQNITGCLDAVPLLDPYGQYNASVLTNICTSNCGSALHTWYSQASSACSNVTYITDEGFVSGISDLIGRVSFNFNETCLQDGGQYCNVILGQELNATNGTGTTVCNMCNLYRLRDTAQSPFDDGPLVLADGLYDSFTSSCGHSYTQYPLSTTPAPPTPATTSATATGSGAATTNAACTGKIYGINSGDTCGSVASSQGTTINWLLLDNNLQAQCANFPANGSLCINHPCNVYTVQSSDTCSSVAASNNITITQLQAWNPWIDSTCYNFNSTIGTSICIGQPGTNKYVTPTGSVGAATSALSAAPVPTDIAPNTTTNCGKYYDTVIGDDCNHISIRFGISLTDFYILNPMVNVNCTNLYANASYCVQPVGSINNYPGSPFYGLNNASDPNAPSFSNYTNATYAPIFPTRAMAPPAPSSSAGCFLYVDGSNLQYGYQFNSDCNVAAYNYNVSLSSLQSWNPSLQTNSTNCTFTSGLSYCMVLNGNIINATVSYVTYTLDGNATATAVSSSSAGGISTTASTTGETSVVVTTSQSSGTSTTGHSTVATTTSHPPASSASSAVVPSPTQSGSISRNCNAYAKAVSGDGCYAFAQEHSISTAHLYDWNSVLGVNGANCGTALQANVYYCTGVSIPSPIQQNSIPDNCDLYAEAVSGDYCYAFAQEHNITTSQLYSWNTILGSNGGNCSTQFQAQTYYCVGTNGAQASTG